MKAIGYRKSLPIGDPDALLAVELPDPEPGPHDLLVEVMGGSVNPVDVKVRMRAEPESGHRILGFDAAGIVRAVGSGVARFRPGDEVYYAGDIGRTGTNAQLHVVDERIVGRKPRRLDWAAAAALPLTAITAWEMLFDCFDLVEGEGGGDALLAIGGAGGVGSILIQLAKALTGLRVVATASRAESRDWCLRMGADAVIDHTQDMRAQLVEMGVTPRYVAALSGSDRHFGSIVELIAPRGEIALIDDPQELDIAKIKPKALSFHWEFMFARPAFETDDMDTQHRLLMRVADLIDDGRVAGTATRNLGPLSVETLKEGHRLQESGRAIGKTVFEALS